MSYREYFFRAACANVKSRLDIESLPWLLDVLWGDLTSTPGEGGVLDAFVLIVLSAITAMGIVIVFTMSTSELELISADTLFSNLAKVTFFSNLGSDICRIDGEVDGDDASLANEVSLLSIEYSTKAGALSTVLNVLFSDICINSPMVIFFEWSLAGEGLMSCWRICFFSAAFFFVGVELFRFLRGDGVPV